MLTQLLECPYTPQRPKLFPDISERQVWGALSCSERWLRASSEVLHSTDALPELPLSLWLDFTRTGNRNHYEAPYFARRRTLCALTIRSRCFGQQQFMQRRNLVKYGVEFEHQRNTGTKTALPTIMVRRAVL